MAIKGKLIARREPQQKRAKVRIKEIIRVTAALFERGGLDALNTTLIAEEVGMSVGSLYHYFPNKHAILYAVAQDWLEGAEGLLADMEGWPVEQWSLQELSRKLVETLFTYYQQQKTMLPLIQTLFAIDELRDLDAQYEHMMHSEMARLYKRLGISKHLKERERLAGVQHAMLHASLISIATALQGERAKRSLDDLALMLEALWTSYADE